MNKNMGDAKKFITDVNKAMSVLNLSAQKLSALASISVSAIYNLQKGISPSTSQTYAKIITALNATINTKTFLEKLEAKKKLLKVSTLGLSKLAGVSYRTLYRIEADGVIPSIKTCCKITKKLDIPLEELIKWPDKKS